MLSFPDKVTENSRYVDSCASHIIAQSVSLQNNQDINISGKQSHFIRQSVRQCQHF